MSVWFRTLTSITLFALILRTASMISIPELEVYGNPARAAPEAAVRVTSAEVKANLTAFMERILG